LALLQVARVKSFIATNKNVLLQFSTDMTNIVPLFAMDGSASFMTASVKAGVALALREVRPLPGWSLAAWSLAVSPQDGCVFPSCSICHVLTRN
jgi:hypothetical protein